MSIESNRRKFRARRRDVLRGGAAAAVATGLAGFPGLLLGQSSPKTVKIGGIWPMTGILAYSGQQARHGARFAADEINARGGIKALGGAKIELLIGDSQSKPEVGASEVDKLSEQGVASFIGSCASGIALTATQASARNKIPFMVDGAVSDQILQRGLFGVYRFSPGFRKITDVSLDNLQAINKAAGNPAKTVILVHEDGAFGSGLAKTLAGDLPKRGFEILDMIGHPTPTRDFTNIGLRLRAAKPDLIIPSSYLNEYTLLARSIYQHRVPMKAIYSVIGGGASNMKFVREYNDAAQNIMDCNHWVDPRKPKTQRFLQLLDKEKVDLTWEVILQYSGVLLIADAMERAGSADPVKVSEALASSTFEDHIMPYGPTKFVNGQNEGAQPINTQVQKMAIQTVFPQQFATAKPIYPVPAR
jgi:branched-chain amino acid transport system substrate-binding protein